MEKAYTRLLLRTANTLNLMTLQLGKAAAWLCALMAIFTVVVVLQRLIFANGSIALQESVTYLHATLISFCCAYTYHQGGHVRVDIFYRRFSSGGKAWVDALGIALLLLPFAVFVCFSSWNYASAAWQIKERSQDAGGLPFVYLLKSLVFVCGLLLLMQAIAELARQLVALTLAEPKSKRT